MTGYVNAKNIALTAVNINNASSNSTVRTAISYGYKYLGTRFILGGSSITNGIDCATFTKQIYEAAGKAMLILIRIGCRAYPDRFLTGI